MAQKHRPRAKVCKAKISKKYILVTGGLGFIGSHMLELLLYEGESVVCIDNLDNYYDPLKKLNNFKEIKNTSKKSENAFTFILMDVCDTKALENIFSCFSVDVVIHLAAKGGVRASFEDPYNYERINVNGTITLLEVMRRFNCKKIIYISSSSVYGKQKSQFNETDSLLQPMSPYALTKYTAEKFCELYAGLYGLSVDIVRPFTVYGPRQRPEMAIFKFVNALDNDRPITIFGNGEMMRDFTHVSDVIRGIFLALRSTPHYGSAIAYNIGSSKPSSLNDTVMTIERILQKKAVVLYKPIPEGEVAFTWANIERATSRLGYKPKVSLEQGLRDFIGWYNKNLKPAYMNR